MQHLGDIPGAPREEGITGLTRTVLVRGRKFNYEEVTRTGEGGRIIRHHVVRHPGSVVILPLLDGPARIVLVRNLRVALGAHLLELPAGTREGPEEPAPCAARELEEETGYTAATLIPLSRFHTSPGMTDELMHAFFARGLTPVGQKLEADESMTVCPVAVGEALAMIESGRITDCKSIAAILIAQRRGLLGVES